MYLHIGKENLIIKTKIILIGNYANKHKQRSDALFFKNAQDNNKIIDISDGDPQSFIVTDDYLYLSLISASTLEKRLGETVV